MHTRQARVWRRSVASQLVGVEGVEEDDEEDHDEEDDDDAPWRVSRFWLHPGGCRTWVPEPIVFCVPGTAVNSPQCVFFYREQPRSVHIVITRATARFGTHNTPVHTHTRR